MALSDKTVAVTLTAKVDGFVAGFKKASAAVDDLTKADINKPARAFDNIATKAALLGGAVALGIGTAVRSFMEFDKQMSAAGAATDTTGVALEGLRAAAIKAGKDTQFSASEAAQGITELGKAGVSAADILGGGLSGALDLAAAGQLSVGEAATTAASAMTQFKLKGADVPHIADLLAAGANKAQGSVHDLGAALNQTGIVASQAGLTIEETTGGLAAFASAGLIGSDAGTSFKTMLQRLIAPSKEAKDLMGELGINAFDVNGNFIGLAEVAGQLQGKLGGLTVEQRNAALATIFGSDAIRAASVLYEQGQPGIQGWIDKVNESGAASSTAAKLMDNLAGDVEQFSGSVETAFIQAGSGGNDALRTIVQGATGVVNALGDIPGPVLLAGSALGALALAGPKAFIAFRQYRSDLDAAGLSLDKISEKAPRVGKGLDLAAKAAKGIAVAFAAAAIASRTLDGDIQQVGVEQLTRDLLGGADAVGVLDKAFRGAVGTGTNFDSNVRSLGDALRYSLDPGFLDQVDSAAGAVFATFGGKNTSDVKIAADRLKELDTAIAGLVTGGHATEAGKVMRQIQDAAAAQGISVDQLKAKFPQYAEALAAVENQSGATKDATSALAGAQDKAAISAEDMAKANDAILKSLTGLSDLVLGARDATREYEASLDAADSALADYKQSLIDEATAHGVGKKAAEDHANAVIASGAALDIGTEAGRKNQAALDAIASSTLGMVTHTFEARDANTDLAGAVATATDQVLKGRDSFIDHAVKMGLSRDAAVALADKLKLTKDNVAQLSQTIEAVPESKTTTIKAETATTNAHLQAVQEKLNFIGDSQPTPVIDAQPAPFNAVAANSKQKLDALDSTVAVPTLKATDQASQVIQAAQGKLDFLGASRPNPTVNANTAPANAAIAGTQSKLGVLDATQADPIVTALDRASGTIAAIQGGLSGIRDKTVTVTTVYASVESGIRHAAGGPVIGPGTGTSDTAGLYALSNGEHVLTAAEVAAAGGHAEIFRLRKALLADRVQYLATGGPVGVPVSALVKAPTPAPVFNFTTPAQGRTGPLLNVEQMITADPRAAMHEVNMSLRTALAANGIG